MKPSFSQKTYLPRIEMMRDDTAMLERRGCPCKKFPLSKCVAGQKCEPVDVVIVLNKNLIMFRKEL